MVCAVAVLALAATVIAKLDDNAGTSVPRRSRKHEAREMMYEHGLGAAPCNDTTHGAVGQ